MSMFDTSEFNTWAKENDVAPGDPPNQGEHADWPEPEPIRNDLRPVAPLRTEMIPAPLRACLADIAYRMQCPIDFIAAAFVVMASILIGWDPAVQAHQLSVEGCQKYRE